MLSHESLLLLLLRLLLRLWPWLKQDGAPVIADKPCEPSWLTEYWAQIHKRSYDDHTTILDLRYIIRQLANSQSNYDNLMI